MKKLLLFIWFAGCLAPAFANNPIASVTQSYTLENGLQLIVREDHRAPVVITQIWYHIGSSDEPNGLTGISHMLEHMMFEGTQAYPHGVFDKLITENGGRSNAETNYDFTNYYEELAAEHLPLSLQLEADRMQHLAITADAFKREQQVVLEERRMRTDDNPQSLLYERFMATANLSNPYHHMPIGWFSDITHLTAADLTAWYKQWYVPNNATIVIVGDVKAEQALKLVKHYFGNIPARPLPISKPHPPQKSLGKKTVEVNLPAKLPLLMLGYEVPSVKTAKLAWEPYALDILAAILSGGESARLSRDLIRNQAIATEADVMYSPYSRYSQQFVIVGVPTAQNSLDDLRRAFKEQIKQLQTSLILPSDLARVINQVTADKIYLLDGIANQASLIGEMVSLGLNWDEPDHYLAMIKQITPAQLQQVARKYLTDDRVTEAVLLPIPPTSPRSGEAK